MRVEQILDLIPKDDLEFLGAETHVDHQVKKLTGILVFKLILFSMLNSTKLSLRVMEAFFLSAQFKKLSNIYHTTSKYNSIRDRISTINCEYFERIFESIFIKYNKLLKEEKAISLIDSTFVSISSKLVQWGMSNGTPALGLRHLKFTVAMKGSLPSAVKFYKEQEFINDNATFPDCILQNKFLADSIIVFDRGLQTREFFNEMSCKKIIFLGRIKTDVRYKQVSENRIPKNDKASTVEILEDINAHLYTSKGKPTENTFRIVKTRIKETQEELFLVTNFFDATPYELAAMYKQRWEIELLFKFLKQHLSLKHIVSRNDNAIRVMIYMTLILATLITVYRKTNKIESNKIAKLKFEIELDNMIIKEIVLMCGGDPSKAAHLWNSS